MLRFRRSEAYWWRRPLVRVRRRSMPVELAVLALELRSNERGSWLNLRPRASGIVELVPTRTRRGSSFRTRREPLPLFVVAALEDIYRRARLRKGCPELVIWRTDREDFRLVALKLRGEQRRGPTSWGPERQRFMETAYQCGVSTKTVVWQYDR